MADRGPLNRDERGRFVSAAEQLRRVDAAWRARVLPVPVRPTPAQILAQPTDRYPRWRLRVFDLCWPWRASKVEVTRDAVMSGNARRDRDGVYLDACANIQRDPPWPYDRYLLRQRRRERGE